MFRGYNLMLCIQQHQANMEKIPTAHTIIRGISSNTAPFENRG